MRLSDEEDPESQSYLEREFRFDRNTAVRTEAKDEQLRAGMLFLYYYSGRKNNFENGIFTAFWK